MINAKTTTMAANEARIDELAQYIDDLDSGTSFENEHRETYC